MKNRSLSLLAAALLLTTAIGSASAETAVFTAGTYTGKANGRGGEMCVDVTFSADRIETIEVKSHQETAGVYECVFDTIPSDIVENQTLAIDTVSGATMSSNGVLNAVKDAVKQAGADPASLTAKVEKTATEQTLDADVVIVGAGGAGLAAAIEAAEAGAKVVLVEANGWVGGGTALSGGWYMTPASEEQAAQYKALDVEGMLTGLSNYGSEYFDLAIARPYVEHANENLQWLLSMGTPLGYQLTVESMAGMYPLMPDDEASTDYTIMETLTPEAYATGADGYGFWLTNGMLDTVRKLDVTLLVNTRANAVLDADGVPCGITAVNERDAISYTVNAKSVVLACGGFGANYELALQHNGSKGPYMGSANCTGFGIEAAEKLGAKIAYADIPYFEEYPEIYNTIGGVFIDAECRVLNQNDQPIAALFSAGEMASIQVVDPPHFSSGINVSWAVYGGRIAGATAAKEALNK